MVGTETMHGALSRRVSATPPAVNASPNGSRLSLLLQPEEPPRLGTGNIGTERIGPTGQDGTTKIHDASDETTLSGTTAIPVSQVPVQTEEAGPPMCGTMHRKVATRTFPWTVIATVNV
jgi:hypothetical protein